MAVARTCPQCGQPLPDKGWEGLCPACVVRVSLETPADSSAASRAEPPQVGRVVPSPPPCGIAEQRDEDIGPSLTRFVEIMGSDYLLTSPRDGSACKRMNLFLRWMVRRTPPDLGIWDFVDPAKLVMPLDTHVHRIATFLGLNDRKSADWKAARAITDELAHFDKADPVRYDFALCRLGILDLCSRKRRKENCDVCLLRDACRFPVRKSKVS